MTTSPTFTQAPTRLPVPSLKRPGPTATTLNCGRPMIASRVSELTLFGKSSLIGDFCFTIVTSSRVPVGTTFSACSLVIIFRSLLGLAQQID